jgi:hypothetical protein
MQELETQTQNVKSAYILKKDLIQHDEAIAVS